MNEISKEQLTARINDEDEFKLVMVATKVQFERGHIPGSINASGFREGLAEVKPGDELVIYGCSQDCKMTKSAVQLLQVMGFDRIQYYSGGLAAWQAAGLPVESANQDP